MSVLQRAVFLDRDGVINCAVIKNGKPYPPPTLDDLIVPEGVEGALRALKAVGFLLIGISNQPDVARGTTRRAAVEAINSALLDRLPIEEILVCYHDDRDGCDCRKPLPGLFIQAASRYNINLSSSFMIGDRWKDIDAGQRAGCTTVWIDYNYDEPAPSSPPAFITGSLQEAVAWILDQASRKGGA